MKLTDAELEAAYVARTNRHHADALRAVQDAVLAKWEVEAREAERRGWDACFRHELRHCDDGVRKINAAERDRQFPSLRRPASVTLSTGTWTKERNGDWTLANYSGRSQAPQAATPADCDALKAYLQAMEGK